MVLAAQNELALALADRDLISKRLIMDAQDSDERMNDLRRKRTCCSVIDFDDALSCLMLLSRRFRGS